MSPVPCAVQCLKQSLQPGNQVAGLSVSQSQVKPSSFLPALVLITYYCSRAPRHNLGLEPNMEFII